MNMKWFMAFSLRPLLPALVILLLAPCSTSAAGDMEELLRRSPAAAGGGSRESRSSTIGTPFPTGSMARLSCISLRLRPHGRRPLCREKSPGAGMDVESIVWITHRRLRHVCQLRQKVGSACCRGRVQSLRLPALPLPGRHFVHIQVTGSGRRPGCTGRMWKDGRITAAGHEEQTPELAVFDGRRPSGDRTLPPQSLLGYDFLNRGIMTDAVVGEWICRYSAPGYNGRIRNSRLRWLPRSTGPGKVEPLGDSTAFLEESIPSTGRSLS